MSGSVNTKIYIESADADRLVAETPVAKVHVACILTFKTVCEISWNGVNINLPSKGDCPGPAMITSKYRRLSSCGVALIPGAGSAIKRSVS